MKTILALALLCLTFNAHAATYMLLSQTNAFAAGITNLAKAYTDAHTGGGSTNLDNLTVTNDTRLFGPLYQGIGTIPYWLGDNSDGIISLHITDLGENPENKLFLGAVDHNSQGTAMNIAYMHFIPDENDPGFQFRILCDTNFQGAIPSAGLYVNARMSGNEANMRLLNNLGVTNFAVLDDGSLWAFGAHQTSWPTGGGSSPFTNDLGVVRYSPGQGATNSLVIDHVGGPTDAFVSINMTRTTNLFGNTGLHLSDNLPIDTNNIPFSVTAFWVQGFNGSADADSWCFDGGDASIGIWGDMGGYIDPDVGAIVALFGSAVGNSLIQSGVVGLAQSSSRTNIGVTAIVNPLASAVTTRTNVALYAGVHVGDGAFFQSNPNINQSATIIADSGASGYPILIGRTNNGAKVFSVEASGAITSGNTNRWTLGATNASGQVAVTVDAMPLHLLSAEGSADLTSLNVGTLYLSNMTANVVPVFDGNTNLVPSATSTNDLNAIAGKATVLGHYMGTDTNALLSALGGQPLLPTATWTQITPDTTNAVVNLTNAIPGVDKNFYYSLSTSNYIIFSNLVQGAQGTIAINAEGTVREVSFSGSYDNYSTNDLTYAGPGVWTLTNRCIIAYKIGWGTDATNVMLAVKKK